MSITTKESHTQHISQQFNSALSDLRNEILSMGGLVSKQVQDSVQSLLMADTELAEAVRTKEAQVDDMERYIDEECTQVIARRQPTASDLRLVISIIKMVADLERIGDEASKIARTAIELAEEGKAPRGYVEVKHISGHVSELLNKSLDCFARFDAESAMEIVREDKEVDQEYKTAMRSLMTFMMEDPRSITQVHSVMWVLRALERVGDHASNIAEHVIFMVKGKDVRHMTLSEAEQVVSDN